MTQLRARHTDVFDLLAAATGMPPRTVERYAERLRSRLPHGWPSVTPGRGEKWQVDPVHITYLTLAVAGAPAIGDAPDACVAFIPMVPEGLWNVDLRGGAATVERAPVEPDLVDCTLGRFVHWLILAQNPEPDLTLCTSAPVAGLTWRTDTGHTDLRFKPPPRSDGLQWWPRFMGPVIHDPERAVRTLRTVPGPLLAALGGLLHEVETAPPVRQRTAERLDDVRMAA